VSRAEVVTWMQRELVVKARDGDMEAYSDLVRLAHPRLFNVARLILRDSDRAGDAVQDALLLAWRHVRSLRDPDAWDAWLHRLTVRACYKVAKKERRRREIEVNVDPDPAMARVPDASIDVAEREWLMTELGRLDIDRRAVVVLHYFLDLTVDQVADILDIPRGTVASRLYRGLDQLRSSLSPEPRHATDSSAERAP
jgi:RNA polymerase sigma-70 factor (ECF subfamily)